MKRRVLLFIVSLLVVCCAAPAFAMDVMMGAKAGYYVWTPFYKDFGASGMSDIDYGTGMLAGPIVSLLLSPDLTFSLAGLAGRQSTHWQSVFSDFHDPAIKITGGYYFDTLRVDVDSALSYRLSDNYKLFVGYKFLYLSTDYKYTELRTTSGPPPNSIDEIDVMDMRLVTPFHGPALGVGASFPLSERVFASANVSGLYMMGNFKADRLVGYSDDGSGNLVQNTTLSMKSSKMEQFGLNVEPAIGFNPGGGLPIISLGVRFQWLRVRFTEKRDWNGGETDKWFDDYLYGIFVSAVYVF
jgi:hypothetical protein